MVDLAVIKKEKGSTASICLKCRGTGRSSFAAFGVDVSSVGSLAFLRSLDFRAGIDANWHVCVTGAGVERAGVLVAMKVSFDRCHVGGSRSGGGLSVDVVMRPAVRPVPFFAAFLSGVRMRWKLVVTDVTSAQFDVSRRLSSCFARGMEARRGETACGLDSRQPGRRFSAGASATQRNGLGSEFAGAGRLEPRKMTGLN